jgi:hypothetical protein
MRLAPRAWIFCGLLAACAKDAPPSSSVAQPSSQPLVDLHAGARPPKTDAAAAADEPRGAASAPLREDEIPNAYEPEDDPSTHGGAARNPKRQLVTRMYHRHLMAFLKHGFSCPAAPTQARACHPSAHFDVSANGKVGSFVLSACGVPALDAAVEASARSKMGEQLPPPPNDYPEIRPESFSVQYRCP